MVRSPRCLATSVDNNSPIQTAEQGIENRCCRNKPIAQVIETFHDSKNCAFFVVVQRLVTVFRGFVHACQSQCAT